MSSTPIFRQPKQFYLIFSIEFWERFGFYGTQAILTVYLVKILKMDEASSFVLFGAFSALLYGFMAVGGWIGDKVIGTKRTITLGAVVMMVGYTLLGLSTSSMLSSGQTLIYIAMGFITIGNGLFKANPSSLLSKLYAKDDPRLDGAFTLYYMAINLGSLISMVITPIIAEKYGYGMAFGVSAAGLAFTTMNFLLCKKMVENVGSEVDLMPVNMINYTFVVLGSTVASFICSFLLQNLTIAHIILAISGVVIVFLYFKEAFRATKLEKQKMIVAFVLMLQGVVFFVLYFQMPTSLNFFAIHNVEHSILGISVEPEQFQALNSFWIMVASPILAVIYGKLGDKLAMPFKFAGGMALCALSFLILKWSAPFADENGIVSSNWLILSYLFQSIGELLVSGLGLAMIAQLVPERLMGFAMGMWYLTSATAAVIAGWIASLTAAPSATVDATQSLVLYANVFEEIGYVTAVVSVFTLLIAPTLTRISSEQV